MDSCLRLGGWRLLRGIWLQKATMSATMRHLNPLWCPQLTHKVCAPAGRLGLAERAHWLVLEPREQALGVKEVATCRDAARAVERAESEPSAAIVDVAPGTPELDAFPLVVDSVEVPAGGEDMESPTASPSPGGQPGGLPLWN